MTVPFEGDARSTISPDTLFCIERPFIERVCIERLAMESEGGAEMRQRDNGEPRNAPTGARVSRRECLLIGVPNGIRTRVFNVKG